MIKNKVIILTGGTGLIGQAFCKSITKNNGYVIVADIMENNEFKKTIKNDNNMEYCCLDVSSEDSIKNIIKYCDKKFGKIDAWINNAYLKTKKNLNNKREYSDDFLNLSYEDFCESVQLNQGSIFLCSKLISKYFLKQGYGNIINISSIYGIIAPRFEVYENTKMTLPIDYATNKSSLIHITKYLSKFLKGKNIRVNCISPGGIKDDQPKSFLSKYNNLGINKGMLDKEDLVGLLLFLISDNSKYINGQNFIIDDGWTL